MQKKLPRNTNSSAHSQDLPTGGLWPKGGWPAAQNIHHANSPIGDEMTSAHEIQKLPLSTLALGEGKSMSWLMIGGSKNFISSFSSGFFFTSCLTSLQSCTDNITRCEMGHYESTDGLWYCKYIF